MKWTPFLKQLWRHHAASYLFTYMLWGRSWDVRQVEPCMTYLNKILALVIFLSLKIQQIYSWKKIRIIMCREAYVSLTSSKYYLLTFKHKKMEALILIYGLRTGCHWRIVVVVKTNLNLTTGGIYPWKHLPSSFKKKFTTPMRHFSVKEMNGEKTSAEIDN